MANTEHLALLQQGAVIWNAWRKQHPEIQPDLRKASLRGTQLEGVNLARADLREANLFEANLASFVKWSQMSARMGRVLVKARSPAQPYIY